MGRPNPVTQGAAALAALISQNSPIQKLVYDLFFYEFQPSFATPIDIVSTVVINAVSPTEIIVAQYTVPHTYEGVIKWIGQDSHQSGIFDNSTWFVRINQAAAFTWQGVDVMKGSVSNPTPETMALTGNDIVTISLILSSSSGIVFPLLAAGRIKGWIWDKSRRTKL
jgi:hypothetical protein